MTQTSSILSHSPQEWGNSIIIIIIATGIIITMMDYFNYTPLLTILRWIGAIITESTHKIVLLREILAEGLDNMMIDPAQIYPYYFELFRTLRRLEIIFGFLINHLEDLGLLTDGVEITYMHLANTVEDLLGLINELEVHLNIVLTTLGT